MKVRILTSTDTNAFRALRLQAIQDSPAAFLQTEVEFKVLNTAELEKWIEVSENRVTVGAFDDNGLIIGIAGLRRESGDKIRHKAQVWGVFVVPEARGKGVSRMMMNTLISEARLRVGLSHLCLSVAESQFSARALYKSIGFQTYGIEPRALWIDGHFLDEELMIYDLKTQ